MLARISWPLRSTGRAMTVSIRNSASKHAAPDARAGIKAWAAEKATERLPWCATCWGQTDTELTRLQQECQRLAAQVSAQGWELSLLRARFARYETALRGSQVTVYTQDRDLRYTSISNPMLGRAIEDILGHTDEEILPPDGGATGHRPETRGARERPAETRGSRPRRRRQACAGTICISNRCAMKPAISSA